MEKQKHRQTDTSGTQKAKGLLSTTRFLMLSLWILDPLLSCLLWVTLLSTW